MPRPLMVAKTLKTPWKISLAMVAIAVLGIAGWWVMAPMEIDPNAIANEGIK